jgi:hypothetical protein
MDFTTLASTLVGIARSGSLESVKMYLEEHPDAVKERDASGRLPLHSLVLGWEEDCGVDVVAYLIKAYPQCLTMADDEGNTPLHSISERDNVPLDLFDLVYDGAQCVSGFCNAKGQKPIHVAIEHGCIRHASFLIKRDYCAFSTKKLGIGDPAMDVYGGETFSGACASDATLDFIRLLKSRAPGWVDDAMEPTSQT